MQAIETHYEGYRFRSRTEARWAVFFKTAGIAFEYEKQGFVLNGKPYLPDFWLPAASMWVEVKGDDPVPDDQMQLCRDLAKQSGHRVLVCIGSPEPKERCLLLEGGTGAEALRGWWQDDRRNDGEFWIATDEIGVPAIEVPGSKPHDRLPLVHSRTKSAYAASRAARFEHGEKA